MTGRKKKIKFSENSGKKEVINEILQITVSVTKFMIFMCQPFTSRGIF